MMYEIIVILFTMNYIANNLSDAKHTIGIRDRSKHNQNAGEVIWNNISNNSKEPLKKWHVSRIRRKQYELVNLLWRKTKIFVNADTTYVYRSTPIPKRNSTKSNKFKKSVPQITPKHHLLTFLPRQIHQTSTQSFIEFYYLYDDSYKELTITDVKNKKSLPTEITEIFNKTSLIDLDGPTFALGITNRNWLSSEATRYKMPPTKRLRKQRNNVLTNVTPSLNISNGSINNKNDQQHNIKNKIITNTTKNDIDNITLDIEKPTTALPLNNITKINVEIDNETCPINTESIINITALPSSNTTRILILTTPYDKIRFFEIYDKQTDYYGDNWNIIYKDNKDNYTKNRLVHISYPEIKVHRSYHNNLNTEIKKQSIKTENNNLKSNESIYTKKEILIPVKFNVTGLRIKENVVTETAKFDSTETTIQSQAKSGVTKWSEYPFVAVYIYQPSQVHCDAAGISAHWLITSGACLSRHHRNPGLQGRSAFISYCGSRWWSAKRINYVKYSTVHPRYNSRDMNRKYLYNIGLVQVITSMASACSGWSPILMMSHLFVSSQNGSDGYAVGWGLDRFDSRYLSKGLTKYPLSIYKNLIYSHSCPGNIGSKEEKLRDKESGIKNVYCLTLPSYLGEKEDPVHGGLLMVGGKLIALYLQEERRPWGQQSAQYTGIWRLIPWVLDVAREPETDSFPVDI